MNHPINKSHKGINNYQVETQSHLTCKNCTKCTIINPVFGTEVHGAHCGGPCQPGKTCGKECLRCKGECVSSEFDDAARCTESQHFDYSKRCCD